MNSLPRPQFAVFVRRRSKFAIETENDFFVIYRLVSCVTSNLTTHLFSYETLGWLVGPLPRARCSARLEKHQGQGVKGAKRTGWEGGRFSSQTVARTRPPTSKPEAAVLQLHAVCSSNRSSQLRLSRHSFA